MTDKNKISKTSKQRKLYGFLILLHMFTGMILGIFGLIHLQRCFNSLIFLIVFGLIGIGISEFVFKKLKPRLVSMQVLYSGLWTLRFYIWIGFVGIILTIGAIFNKTTSRLKSCDSYTVIEKQYVKRGFRTGEAFLIYVDIEGQTKRINCNKKIWDKMRIGQFVDIYIYKSLINFDYFEPKGCK
jgi:hypothetical protein